MEKERMREEIRQEMEMERRALEAEVRRELMEQYALQRPGLSLQSSQQHLMDFVVSPQTMRHARAEETALGGKQNLVILEKAGEENKTARKRKALSPPPQAAEETDVPLVETREKRFYCEVCRVSSNGELSLQGHLWGRKHKSKEAALSAKKKEAVENLRFPFWCRICKVGAHTEDVMLRHELGKKHVNRLGRPKAKFSVLVNDLAEWVDMGRKALLTRSGGVG